LLDPDQRAIVICPVFHAQLREAVRQRLSLTPAAPARGLYKPNMEPANHGFAIHGTTELHRLGGPASHGCVRLHPANAATLYALVERDGRDSTRIEIY